MFVVDFFNTGNNSAFFVFSKTLSTFNFSITNKRIRKKITEVIEGHCTHAIEINMGVVADRKCFENDFHIKIDLRKNKNSHISYFLNFKFVGVLF